MLPHLSALENATVFRGALQMSMFTLLYFKNVEVFRSAAACAVAMVIGDSCRYSIGVGLPFKMCGI